MTNNDEQRSPEELALLALAQGPIVTDEIAPVVIQTETFEPAVVIPEPVVIIPEPEQTYSWQPTDEAGRPLGGKQVIKFRNQEEFAAKFAENNTLLLRKLRTETRNNRLGIQYEEPISDTDLKMEASASFTPRDLTGDERAKLSRDLLDPDTFDAATDTLLEARMGVKPSVLAQTVQDLQLESLRNKAVAESESFKRANPDYVLCDENSSAITSWLVRYKLAPVKANFQKAYDTLKTAGVLVVAGDPVLPIPEVVQQVETPAIVTPDPILEETLPALVTAPVVAAPAIAPVVSRVATGLTRGQAGDVGTPRTVGDDIVYEVILPGGGKRVYTGAAAINAMPSDVYKHRLQHEPGFKEKDEKLNAVATKRQFVSR